MWNKWAEELRLSVPQPHLQMTPGAPNKEWAREALPVRSIRHLRHRAVVSKPFPDSLTRKQVVDFHRVTRCNKTDCTVRYMYKYLKQQHSERGVTTTCMNFVFE